MIRYFKCANCGKRGMDQTPGQSKRFCCKKCSEDYRRRKRGQGIAKEDRKYCLYNDGVECYDRTCGKCGWNPVVAERRKAQITGVARGCECFT